MTFSPTAALGVLATVAAIDCAPVHPAVPASPEHIATASMDAGRVRSAPPAVLGAASRSVAGARLVTFPSRDADLVRGDATVIDGWLFQPEGPGPFAAVVALHGCAGLYGGRGDLTARHRDWAERLVREGYVVLMPDSFSARGLDEICSRDQRTVRPSYERNRDVYGALEYLEGLPFVRTDRVALLGWSNGGMTVLAAVAARTRARPTTLPHLPVVAVAFYPGCRSTVERADWLPPAVALHILIGELDDWTPASECVELAAQAERVGAPIDVVVYPGAYHDFDDPVMKVHVRDRVATTPSGTATIGQDPAARADSVERVTRILRQALRP
jgi:dienelactone hydrolase